jgi:hypothetical protein
MRTQIIHESRDLALGTSLAPFEVPRLAMTQHVTSVRPVA